MRGVMEKVIGGAAYGEVGGATGSGVAAAAVENGEAAAETVATVVMVVRAVRQADLCGVGFDMDDISGRLERLGGDVSCGAACIFFGVADLD